MIEFAALLLVSTLFLGLAGTQARTIGGSESRKLKTIESRRRHVLLKR